MLPYAELGLIIPIVLIILALVTRDDPEFTAARENLKSRHGTLLDLGRLSLRSRIILLAGVILLAAVIFTSAGVLYARGLDAGEGTQVALPGTGTPARGTQAGGAASQETVSSSSAISVTETVLSSPPGINLP